MCACVRAVVQLEAISAGPPVGPPDARSLSLPGARASVWRAAISCVRGAREEGCGTGRGGRETWYVTLITFADSSSSRAFVCRTRGAPGISFRGLINSRRGPLCARGPCEADEPESSASSVYIHVGATTTGRSFDPELARGLGDAFFFGFGFFCGDGLSGTCESWGCCVRPMSRLKDCESFGRFLWLVHSVMDR